MVGDGSKVVVPDAVGYRGFQLPTVVAGELLDFSVECEWRRFWGCWDPTIVAGKLLGVVVKDWRGWERGRSPTIVASELLGVVVKDGWSWGRNRSPTIVTGKLLQVVVERNAGKYGNKG